MRAIVAPASPQTGKAVITALLQHTPTCEVVGVYRNLGKVPAAFANHPSFTAVQGDVADGRSLDFSGCDVVVTISPPQYSSTTDPIATAKQIAENVKAAVLRASSVKRLVYVSTVGGEHESGTGELLTNHVAEETLKDATSEVVLVRCAYFMQNWASAISTVTSDTPRFSSVITPEDFEIPMVSVKDIGKVCAAEATAVGAPLDVHPYVFELHGSQWYSTNDVKKAFEEVIQKPVHVDLVTQDELRSHFGAFIPPVVADSFVEMTRSFLPGGCAMPRKEGDGEVRLGTETLVDAFREMLQD
ncbi:uncharacterized protein B0I36DRAFT_337432 [Microdochium trichocladiopsis]|uniref:NAD(P)-binding domain-containing protein n=1 Tax=Microdochium trichocladiopsis TaxID=1682393 RepID=A0A9P8XTM7_9PEZI|nr:uncharacterized protein B0I36DRAFT_337432 [Microdochium trichocladiopsis]KAH7016354.1 hypothetical protein B0I36DRAFT_337432 [Microdochium trichocladiopsis]